MLLNITTSTDADIHECMETLFVIKFYYFNWCILIVDPQQHILIMKSWHVGGNGKKLIIQLECHCSLHSIFYSRNPHSLGVNNGWLLTSKRTTLNWTQLA